MRISVLALPLAATFVSAIRQASTTSTTSIQSSVGAWTGAAFVTPASQLPADRGNAAVTQDTAGQALRPVKRQAPRRGHDAPVPQMDPLTSYIPFNDGLDCPADYYLYGRICESTTTSARYEMRCYLSPTAYRRYPSNERVKVYYLACSNHHVCKNHDRDSGTPGTPSIDCISRYDESIHRRVRRPLPPGASIRIDRSGAAGGGANGASGSGSAGQAGPSIENSSWQDILNNRGASGWH